MTIHDVRALACVGAVAPLPPGMQAAVTRTQSALGNKQAGRPMSPGAQCVGIQALVNRARSVYALQGWCLRGTQVVCTGVHLHPTNNRNSVQTCHKLPFIVSRMLTMPTEDVPLMLKASAPADQAIQPLVTARAMIATVFAPRSKCGGQEDLCF